MFSGKNVAATSTNTDEVQKEELEEKNLEKVEVEVVLERMRSLVVQMREKEEEGSK